MTIRRTERSGVLFAHPSADVYGSDRQLLESIEAVRADGEPVVVCLPAGGPLEPLLAGCAVRKQRFPVLRKAMLRPLGLLRLVVMSPVELGRMIATLRAVAPSVVYVNTLTIPWWILAARVTRTPVLVHVHEAEQDVPAVVRFLLAAPLLLSTRVIANSEASRRTLRSSLGRIAPDIAVVANGVPDGGPSERVLSDAGRLAVVARLSPRKGVDVALEAVAILRGQGRDVHLDVAGTVFPGYEWYESQLRERASQGDLRGHVTFLGYVHPTAEILSRASVVLVPSRTEPFGNTAVEAQLACRPVVASRVQGLAEIVVDGLTGILVPPENPASLARAVAGLLDDPATAHRIAGAAREQARDRFGVERYRREIRSQLAMAIRRGVHCGVPVEASCQDHYAKA